MLNAEMSWTPQEVGGSHVQPNILLQYLHDLSSHWHIWGTLALTLTEPPLLKAESHCISLSQKLCSHPSFPSPGTLRWAYKTCSNIYYIKTTLDPTSFLTINPFLCSITGQFVHAGLSISFFFSILSSALSGLVPELCTSQRLCHHQDHQFSPMDLGNFVFMSEISNLTSPSLSNPSASER